MVVRFYKSPGGASPVEKYLVGLDGKERAKVAESLDAIAQYGLEPSRMTMRQLDGRLWEFKIGPQRLLYVTITGPEVVVLHAYRKQTQRAPPRELEVARKRMKEVLENET